jgi:hypothetical protein
MSQRLLITNVAPEASDEELTRMVKKYCAHECKVVLHVDDGDRPARMLQFTDLLPMGALEEAASRIAGLHWKGRTLSVYRPLYPFAY